MGLKKAILFTVDAIIASIIIVFSILLYSNFYLEESRSTHLSLIADDMLNTLSELKISEIDNNLVKDLINHSNITNLNNSVLEQIGEFWALNKTDLCLSLIKNVTSELFPGNLGFSIALGNEEIYFQGDQKRRNLIAARKMISGYEKSQPVKGSTSRAYLKAIQGKRFASYYYFGGFIGEGNITGRMEFIPNDALIESSFIEISAASDFQLYINNSYCGSFHPPTQPNITSSRWNISNCNSLFKKGAENSLAIIFQSPLNESYIGGGYLKVEYTTSELNFNQSPGIDYFYFNGIDGLINIYSSFDVPGILNSMEAYIHLKTNQSVFLAVGNKIVMTSSSPVVLNGTEQKISLNNTYLSAQLDYSSLNLKTIPLRFGTVERNFSSILDIALVNDRSGSMAQSGWSLTTTIGTTQRIDNVVVPDGGNSPSYVIAVPVGTQRLAVSINWSRVSGFPGSEGSEFVVNLRRPVGTWIFSDTPNEASGVVDPPGNIGQANEYFSGISTKPQVLYVENPPSGNWRVRVYGWNLRPTSGPPASQNVNISIYYGTAAQIIRNATVMSNNASKAAARRFVQNMEPVDRGAYVVFGSAGNAFLRQNLTFNTTLLEIAINNTGQEGGTAIQNGIITARNELVNNGRLNASKIMIILTDGQNDAGPAPVIGNATLAKNQGIIIFTVGLTGFVNQDMLRQVASQPDYFYYTQDASGLEQIYDLISQKITATYKEQVITTTQNYNLSYLYNDSYIKINFTPIVSAPSFGEIEITSETEKFANCTPSILIPSGIRILNAKVLSFSGKYWTSFLSVNNNQVFNLSDYGTEFEKIGDPFVINIPPNLLVNGQNNLTVLTSASNSTNFICSSNNTLIYKAAVQSSVSYGAVWPLAEGCKWSIETEDSSYITIFVPSSYAGTKICSYNSSGNHFDNDDSIDHAVFGILSYIDFDKDGRINFNINEMDFQIEALWVSQVPYLWGPAIFEVRAWQ